MSASRALPMRFYRDPAEAVAFDQVRALYREKRCFACRHWVPQYREACEVNKQPGMHWCEGFDPR